MSASDGKTVAGVRPVAQPKSGRPASSSVPTSFVQRIRVPAGFLFATVFIYSAQPGSPWLPAGLVVATLGQILRVWAAGHLRKHRKLTVSGPYRWSRNPLYLGSFIMGLGFSVTASVWWLLLLFLVVFTALYIPVMKKEEAELLQAYGAYFQDYREQVPLWVPVAGQRKSSGGGNFTWSNVILNGEYKSVIGFLLLTIYLVVRWN